MEKYEITLSEDQRGLLMFALEVLPPEGKDEETALLLGMLEDAEPGGVMNDFTA